MRLIGLCGRSGSGKGEFAAVAKQKGITVIDCDKLYASLVSHPTKCLAEIEKAFGSESVRDGALNRAYMAPLVFSDAKSLARLNRISHKHVKAEIAKVISSLPEDTTVLLDAPTLFESGLDSRCDLIIGVVAPYEQCVRRITVRDNISGSAAKSRLNSQVSDDFIIENCDTILYNDSSLESFISASSALVDDILRGTI